MSHSISLHHTSLSPFNRKILIVGATFLLLIELTDTLLEMAAWLINEFIELLHTLFEVIELSLDHAVEILFHTGLHSTQVIVFYAMLGAVLWFGYRFLRTLPRWCNSFAGHLNNFWLNQKYLALYQWQRQSILQKLSSLGFAALYMLALYLLYF